MSEQDNNTTPVNISTDESEKKCASHRKACGDSHGRCCGKRHRVGRIIGMVALVSIVVVAVTACGSGPRWHHHGDSPFASGGEINVERIAEMAGKRLDHMLDEVDASDEQKAKAQEIVKRSLAEGAPKAEQLRDSRQQFAKLLTAPTLDKAAIEQLRADQIRGADEMSKIAIQTIVQVAEVLTPEQRKELAEEIADKMEHRRGWRH